MQERVAANALGGLQAVHARQAPGQDDQIKRMPVIGGALQTAQGVKPRSHIRGLGTDPLQHAGNAVGIHRISIHDQRPDRERGAK